jgi:chromate reductase
MPSVTHIVGFAGSLRKGSYNRAGLRAAQALVPAGAALEIVVLDDLPLFNEDFEFNPPPAVQTFKKQVRQADAVLIATPEYNYSMSGVLKNAIDWLSRPLAECPLTAKPTAIMGFGGRYGTVRAQQHLRQVLLYLDTPAITKPEVHVINAWKKFDADGNLTDDIVREQIRLLLVKLVDKVREAQKLHDQRPIQPLKASENVMGAGPHS